MDPIRGNHGSLTLEEMAASRPRGLRVLRNLLDRLDGEGVRYCHWKSNEHLFEGMVGMTDLDVLFERRGTPRLDRIFGEAGYKRLQTTPMRWHPGLEDYLGFDEETGALVHVHAHHQLRMGEKNAKGYWLPWEDLFLATRHIQEPEGMYASHPDVEMIIYFLRSALKSRLRDRVMARFGTDYMHGALEREFHWLLQRCDPRRVRELVNEHLGAGAASIATDMMAVAPSLESLVRFRRAANPVLRRCRSHDPLTARLRRWNRELFGLRAKMGRRYTHPPRPFDRTLPGGGVLVALIGSDGSGKSTIHHAMVKWLSWKVDVLPLYHGSGDGPSSLLRWPMKAGLKLMGAGGGSGDAPRSGRPSPLRRVLRRLRPLWALVLSLEKRRKLFKGWRARNRGMVVICDRYPQNQIPGYNDGPLLGHWTRSPWRLLRTLGRWEGSPYRWAEWLPPDLVIRLNVSPELARERKHDMSLEELERRAGSIRSLEYPEGRVVDVDADAPFDQVLLQVKKEIWRVL